MLTMLVWYLVSISGTNSITYSPPISTLPECLHLQTSLPSSAGPLVTRCIQVSIVITKS